MNYAAIKKHDIANGPGVRVSLFVSGCTHHCEGCFNPETWDFQYGTPYTAETELEILEALEPDYIRGLSLLGANRWSRNIRRRCCPCCGAFPDCIRTRPSGATPATTLSWIC